jgi:leucyl aminopeptidase (aminopeptidase T)
VPYGVVTPEEWSRLAVTVLKRSLRLRRGQSVIIETWTHGVPAAEAFAIEARRLGIRPLILYESERGFFDAQAKARPQDAAAISEAELAAVAAADGYVYLPGPEDLDRWNHLPEPNRRALDQWIVQWSRVVQRHSVRVAYLHIGSATASAAARLGVDVAQWQREALEGTFVDPRAFRRDGRPLVARLSKGHRVTVTHPNGTHLDLGLAGYRPILQDGTIDVRGTHEGRNWAILPGGYVVVPLNDRIADGRVLANRPSRHRRGIESGARWTFRGGRLVDYAFDEGRAIFEESYRTATKERDRPAILSIGLNPKVHDAPLLADQELGVVTVYIGRNDDFGGRTRGSFRDYALIEGADVSVDDRPIVRAGRLV